MATIQEIKTKLLNANALGRANLALKGVEVAETATTYEIMQGIGNISSGGGASEGNYKEVFNALHSASLTNATIERVDFYIANPFLSLNGFFRNTRNLKYVKGINTSGAIDIRLMFSGSAIETIEEPMDISQVTKVNNTQNAFACDNLTEIRFVSGTIKISIDFSRCAKLSAQSIQSIIDGLATITTAQTLTLNSTIVLTDEQKATITAKGWNLVQES